MVGICIPKSRAICERPLACSLLPGLVQDHVHQGLSRLVVLDREDLGRKLDEEGVQDALVPEGEDVGKFGGGQAQHLAQDVVGLGDQLHVAVLDAVVHHLHEMAGAVRAAVGHAGARVGLGRDGLENGPHELVGLGASPGHDGGAETARLPRRPKRPSRRNKSLPSSVPPPGAGCP